MPHSKSSIDFATMQKNSSGVFELSADQLHGLRFTDVPYYSTVAINATDGDAAEYSLEFTATHAGGPHNEEFSLFVHVTYRVPGSSDDPIATNACTRRNRHIRRFFAATAATLGVRDGLNATPFMAGPGCLYGGVLFSRYFERADAPILGDYAHPFIATYEALLSANNPFAFICHASEDKPFVERLCAYFDTAGLPVWYDRREIAVGDSIVQRVEQGLSSASHLIAVFSTTSVSRPWVQRELSSSLMRQLGNQKIQVLPVLIDGCQLPALFADIKYADCRVDERAGFQTLLEAMQ